MGIASETRIPHGTTFADTAAEELSHMLFTHVRFHLTCFDTLFRTTNGQNSEFLYQGITDPELRVSFFQGCVFYPAIINISQLNQIVHLNSATTAGVRILPLLLPSSFSSMITGIVFSKTTRFGWQILALGGSLVLLGTGLLIELPFTQDVLPRSYGYQVVLGMGLGSAVPAIMILTRIEVEDRDNGKSPVPGLNIGMKDCD